MRRSLTLLLLLLAAFSAAPGAFADEVAQSANGVLVIDIDGPIDQRVIEFVTEAIESASAQAIVLQIDSPGVSSGDPQPMFDAVTGSPIPVIAWIGPSPARALGGAAVLAPAAHVTTAAPGTDFGFADPVVLRGDTVPVPAGVPSRLVDDVVTIDASGAGVVDMTPASIGLLVVGLDSMAIETVSGTVTLDTADTVVGEDGVAAVTPIVPVRFDQPGLFTRFLRLASTPEAVFLFLTLGLTLVAFEFYAAGVGITAAVAILCLFLAGYGLATLPMRWSSVVLVVLGLLAYLVDFQRGRAAALSLIGTGLLLYGGLTLTSAAPQYTPKWWAVALTLIGIVAFIVFGLTTVVRSRFSTITIGRDHLIGRLAVVESGFDPDGVVVVDGARWRASAHRAAAISPGDEVEVMEVRGIVLEVEPRS
ncbi:MAG: hypothetical protein HKO87_04260 [Acidimicrobiia bacterium]|nr:hypothetical protein [Acidimicrobiia bacterium]